MDKLMSSTLVKNVIAIAGISALFSIVAGCAQSAPRTPEIARIEASPTTQKQLAAIPSGKSSFIHRDAKGREIKVFSYKPQSFSPDSAIWFAMHGIGRDAEKTRDEWLVAADQNGLLILAPEFSEASFPKSADYTMGEINGDDFSQSSYSAIENIFDSAVAATSSNQKAYRIFGHSAGGQFVQKMMMLMPTVRADFAIAANPGWFLMPSCAAIAGEVAAFPYSFAGGPYSAEKCPSALARGLSRNVMLMLGAEDRDPAHPQLSKTAGAMLQGSNRFERGTFFIEQMRKAGEAGKLGHMWKAQVVPGVGHNGHEMAQSAIFITYRPSRNRR
jgi:poly(3-hydroxybutyrate) depolymerase